MARRTPSLRRTPHRGSLMTPLSHVGRLRCMSRLTRERLPEATSPRRPSMLHQPPAPLTGSSTAHLYGGASLLASSRPAPVHIHTIRVNISRSWHLSMTMPPRSDSG
eukprot:41333-Eustigmatos_ZCMA.PRE.2